LSDSFGSGLKGQWEELRISLHKNTKMSENIKIKKVIECLEKHIKDPSKGLPEDIFLFVSRMVPMINVDLLIKNDKGQTLLIWRHDKYYGPGWHIPGGIIRYKEKMADRVAIVAKNELGTTVDFEENPIAVNEMINPIGKDRGHFISLLFSCKLKSDPDKNIEYTRGAPDVGQWSWRNSAENLIEEQKIYKKFI
jgi:colanic acid biosynthesis protein WcaH